MDAPGGRDLLAQLIQCLLFSTDLWINASGNVSPDNTQHNYICVHDNELSQVQSYLYSHLAIEFGNKPLGKSGLLLRDLLSVPQLLFALREHYNVTVCEEDKRNVRPYILLLVKEFVLTVSLTNNAS